MAHVAGDSLGAIAPQDNPLLCVDDAEPTRKTLEDAAPDFRIVKRKHGCFARNKPVPLTRFIGKSPLGLKSTKTEYFS